MAVRDLTDISAPDSPGVAVAARHHHLLAHLDRVQVVTSEGMKPSVSMYQRALFSKSGVSMTRWPSLVTCGGSSAGRCVSFTRTIWLGALCGIAGRVGSGSEDA